MKTRVLEICKARGISLSDLAEKIGVKQANLSQSLNNNPTLSTLKAVADNLGVEIADLFEKQDKEVSGYLEVGSEIRKITGVADLLPIVGTFGIRPYSSYKVCKKEVKEFVRKGLKGDEQYSSFAGILEGRMLFSISHTSQYDDSQFMLSTYSAGQKPITVCFEDCAFSDGEGNYDLEELITLMWAEIIGCIDPNKEYTDEEMKEREVF